MSDTPIKAEKVDEMPEMKFSTLTVGYLSSNKEWLVKATVPASTFAEVHSWLEQLSTFGQIKNWEVR